MTSYVLLLLSMAGTSMSSETLTTISSNNNPSQDTSSNGQSRSTLTLPLINHHTMTRRRMREMGLDENEMESYLDSLPQRPSHPLSRRTSLEVGGLYQGIGTHYVDLWVGTPPQRQTVIVDTGSGVTAFPCSACRDCGKDYHASPFFVEVDSSSFQKHKCDSCSDRSTCTHHNQDDEYCKIGVSYSEGSSWSAYEAKDDTYLGGPHNKGLHTKAFEAGDGKHLSSGIIDENPEDAASFSFPLQFGCQTSVTGLFKTQYKHIYHNYSTDTNKADGIMGMYNENVSFWHQMFDAGIIERKQFSLCFSRESDSSSEGTSAGAITMGGVDTKLHKIPMVFADGHLTSDSMHGLTIRKVYLTKAGQYDGTEVTQGNTIKLDITTAQLNRGTVLLDSGTTATYFTRDIAKTFMKVFKSEVGVDYQTYTMRLTDAEYDKLPSVVVQLNGYSGSSDIGNTISNLPRHPRLAGKLDPDHPNDVLVVISPDHYLEYNTKTDKYKSCIDLNEGSGVTLGANFMAGHDVLFDIAENNRIGFAISDCSYPRLINNKPSADQNTAPSASFSKISPTKSPKRNTPTTSTLGKLFPVEEKSPTKSPKRNTPTTSTLGKFFPIEEKIDEDACDSFACKYKQGVKQGVFISGVLVIVLLVLGLIRMKYVSYTHLNLEEIENLSLMHPDEEKEREDEIDEGIVKEIEMREIS